MTFAALARHTGQSATALAERVLIAPAAHTARRLLAGQINVQRRPSTARTKRREISIQDRITPPQLSPRIIIYTFYLFFTSLCDSDFPSVDVRGTNSALRRWLSRSGPA